MKELKTLNDLFEEELKDIYSAEQMVMESLPKMIEGANSKELKDKFELHLKQTQEQIDRLEDVFEMMDMEPEAEKCDGMEGIIKDGEKILKAKGESHVKDAALIAAAQKVEHYEIASYGTLREWAHELGHEDAAKKLEMTLKEETKTDQILTGVAEHSANVESPKH